MEKNSQLSGLYAQEEEHLNIQFNLMRRKRNGEKNKLFIVQLVFLWCMFFQCYKHLYITHL